MSAIVQYLQGVRAELKKVIWPSRHETMNHTLAVIGISLAVAVFIGAVDYLLNFIVENLLQVF